MTGDELEYIQFIHQTAGELEDLARHKAVPLDILMDAAGMRIIDIGEASNQVRQGFPELWSELERRVPEVDWESWKDFRNVRGHELSSVDPQVVAEAVTDDAPLLRGGLEREFGLQLSPEQTPPVERGGQREGAGVHGPDLLEFCRTRRGLQPGQQPTEQDILVYNWVRAPKRVIPRLVALWSADRQSRVLLSRERG